MTRPLAACPSLLLTSKRHGLHMSHVLLIWHFDLLLYDSVGLFASSGRRNGGQTRLRRSVASIHFAGYIASLNLRYFYHFSSLKHELSLLLHIKCLIFNKSTGQILFGTGLLVWTEMAVTTNAPRGSLTTVRDLAVEDALMEVDAVRHILLHLSQITKTARRHQSMMTTKHLCRTTLTA